MTQTKRPPANPGRFISYKDPAQLRRRDRNPRTHTPNQIKQIAASIKYSALSFIREEKEGYYTTISGFFSARLDPAIETCDAVETRLARLSNQVERAIDLMRTGILSSWNSKTATGRGR